MTTENEEATVNVEPQKLMSVINHLMSLESNLINEDIGKAKIQADIALRAIIPIVLKSGYAEPKTIAYDKLVDRLSLRSRLSHFDIDEKVG